MGAVVVLVIICLIIFKCCEYPIRFMNEYVAEYDGNFIGLVFSGILGVCLLWMLIALEMESWWSGVAIIAVILSGVMIIYSIFKEMARTTAPKLTRFQFIICHIIFVIGVFGGLFLLLGMCSSAGNSKRKKR